MEIEQLATYGELFDKSPHIVYDIKLKIKSVFHDAA